MKVLMINSVCGIRSTGRICTDIADVLADRGHECKIAYGRENVPQKYEKYAVRIGSDTDVKLHGAESRIFDNTGFGSKRATKRFIEWVKEYDPDVIHLHNIHGYYINIAVLFNYLRTCGKRIVWTLHDCWSFTGHCTNFEHVGCEKWKHGCSRCPQLREYPSSIFADRSEKNWLQKKRLFCGIPNMTVVTPSRWLADLVKQSFLGEYDVRVINNGIDLSVFKPTESDFRAKYGIEDKKIVLGVASTWSKRKGLDDFMKLDGMLGDEYKTVLVGLDANLMKSIPQNIIGIMRTDSVEELAGIYTAADVFVNPTYEDNYPTVNLEAQACGTPVVSYKTGGSPESVNTDYGFVVPQGDLNAAAKRIAECAEKGKTDEYINSVDFSKHTAYNKYIDLY